MQLQEYNRCKFRIGFLQSGSQMSVLSAISILLILNLLNFCLALDNSSLSTEVPVEVLPKTPLNPPTGAVEGITPKSPSQSAEVTPLIDDQLKAETALQEFPIKLITSVDSNPNGKAVEATTVKPKAKGVEETHFEFHTEIHEVTPSNPIVAETKTGQLSDSNSNAENTPPLFFQAPKMSTIFDRYESPSSPLFEQVLLLERDICSNNCEAKGGITVEFQNRRSDVYDKCHRCHCDHICVLYNDCCPDILVRHNWTYVEEKQVTCTSLVPFPYEERQPKMEESVAFIAKCPNNYTEIDDVLMCENPDVRDPSQSLPVTSLVSGISYRNIYCAECRNDSANLSQWAATVSCDKSFSGLMNYTTSKEELFRALTSPEVVQRTGCELRYSQSAGPAARLCSMSSPHLISSCNVTGKLKIRDSRFEEACAMYTSPFFGLYKNMFCYQCNLEYPMHYDSFYHFVHTCCSSHVARLSFSALLDFSESEVDQQSSTECLENEFYNTQKCQCEKPKCSEGKFLTKNGTCQSLLKSNILGYNVCSRVNIVLSEPPTISDIDIWKTDNVQTVPDSLFNAKVWVSEWCPGDKSVTLHFNENYTDRGYLEDLEFSIMDRGVTYKRNAEFVFDTNTLEMFTVTIHPCQDDPQFVHDSCNSNNSVYFPVSRYNGMLVQGFKEYKIYFIKFMATHTCAHVDLPLKDFGAIDNVAHYIYKPSGRKINMSKVDRISDSLVRMCVFDYKTLTENSVGICRLSSDNFDTWTVSGLVSIICTCISLLCLLLTFVTYILLAPLRSGGGKNIMTLTLALFTAQAFYEFALEQFENTSVCKGFGIIIHYTWMAAVFSMNACTVERFYKLCFPLSSRSVFMSRKPFILSTGYTLFCPFVIVSLNVIVNQMTRGEIGYGSSTLCFINTLMSRILAFALPMGILILINVILFLITVGNLRKRRTPGEEKSNSDTRVNLAACVRLSIVTGLTWLLVFLYELINSEYLGYVITALIGLQGVLFFLSLIINKRVLSMYAKFFSVGRRGQAPYSANLQNNRSGHSKGSSRGSRSNQETNNTNMSK